jgi:hypothetical protein
MMKIIFFLIFTLPCTALSINLHIIDQLDNGFGIYRTGLPTKADIKKMCDMGITEMMVMSGNAQDAELKYQDECPQLKVVYNQKQSPKVTLTKDFLNFFDQWVETARAEGKKIAFRCNCGCHRTGRLAAYYQMKYQNLYYDDAIAIMKKHGKFMIFYRYLDYQVKALFDYIQGQECSQKPRYCISDEELIGGESRHGSRQKPRTRITSLFSF